MEPLSLSTDGCPVIASDHNVTERRSVSDGASASAEEEDRDDYFYLYQISYAWYALIGFLLTMSVGYASSVVLGGGGEADQDLFFPWVRRRMLLAQIERDAAADDDNDDDNDDQQEEAGGDEKVNLKDMSNGLQVEASERV